MIRVVISSLILLILEIYGYIIYVVKYNFNFTKVNVKPPKMLTNAIVKQMKQCFNILS